MGSLSRRLAAAALVAACAAPFVGGCVRDKGATPGEVMVEITTNLAVPKDLTSVQIIVTSNGVTKFDQTDAVGPNDLHLPATFGIVVGPGDDPTAPAKIDVIGYRGAVGAETPQIVNEAVVTIPEEGIVLLRMPLDYLCLGNYEANPAAGDAGARGALVDGGASSAVPYVPMCPTGEACVAGTCEPDVVDGETLPAFEPAEVFGGGAGPGAGACFDVVTCFASERSVTLSAGSPCTFALPSGVTASELNVAIATTNGDGTCLAGGACLVPLDEGEGGFSLNGSTVTLPEVVCATGAKVVVSGLCASKTAAEPLCGAASSVTGPAPDAGGDAAPPGHDASTADASAPDAEGPDAKGPDASAPDATHPSDGSTDAQLPDGSMSDSGAPDAGADSGGPPPPGDAGKDSSVPTDAPTDSADANDTGVGPPPVDAGCDAGQSGMTCTVGIGN